MASDLHVGLIKIPRTGCGGHDASRAVGRKEWSETGFPLADRLVRNGEAPAKVWLNGHEWAKRQATKAGLSYRELANGFAACAEPERLRAIGDRLDATAIQAFVDHWLVIIPTPLNSADREAGYWWELSMRQVEVSRALSSSTTRAGRVPSSSLWSPTTSASAARTRCPWSSPAASRRTPPASFGRASSGRGQRCGWTSNTSTAGSSSTSRKGGRYASRDRHQRPRGHRRQASHRPPRRTPEESARGQSSAAYNRTCRPGLCHRFYALRAHPTALRT